MRYIIMAFRNPRNSFGSISRISSETEVCSFEDREASLSKVWGFRGCSRLRLLLASKTLPWTLRVGG